MANPTINDIARVAKVSLATVDRVLNARPGVRDQTVQRVNLAIAQLGYVRDAAAATLARGRAYRFVFVLPATDNEFVSLLESQITQLAHSLRHERTEVSYIRVTGFDPVAFASVIDAIDVNQVDGVAIMGPETPSVRDSIANLRRHGVTVTALVADIPSSDREHFVGIDNAAAGRTAAQLMGRFLSGKSGKIMVLMGSMLARDNIERRLGFDEVMARDFPNLTVMASLEGRDDPELITRLLSNVMAQQSDILGIYSSAASNAGVLQYFQTSRGREGPVIIAQELTPLTRDGLQSGLCDAVISQDVGHLVRSAVRVMRAHCDKIPINTAQERIRIDVYLKENMPL